MMIIKYKKLQMRRGNKVKTSKISHFIRTRQHFQRRGLCWLIINMLLMSFDEYWWVLIPFIAAGLSMKKSPSQTMEKSTGRSPASSPSYQYCRHRRRRMFVSSCFHVLRYRSCTTAGSENWANNVNMFPSHRFRSRMFNWSTEVIWAFCYM